MGRLVSIYAFVGVLVSLIGAFGAFQYERDRANRLESELADVVTLTDPYLFGGESKGNAKLVGVTDGDTFTCDIDLGWDGVCVKNQKLRLFDFDAWEVSRVRRTVGLITDEELAKGRAARADLQDFLSKAQSITVEMVERDTYGRPVVVVTVDGQDLAEYMRSRGHERK